MSLHDYAMSRQIAADDYPFASLIMAALRQADSGNAAILRMGFPDICDEMQERYEAPGGVIAGDPFP